MKTQPGNRDRRLDHLVVLSIPYQRLNRLLLSPAVLASIPEDCDIAIVSPFADDPAFQAEFAAQGRRFLVWSPPVKIAHPIGGLLSLSELLRRKGFFRRFRNEGMEYYLSNAGVIFGRGGSDTRVSPPKRLIYWMCSIVGIWPGAWRLPEALVGPLLFSFRELRQVADVYGRVTLIQSASFGLQDRMLAWMGRGRWRTVMIPHTTDQLLIHGYLLSNYDAVCVQGPFEEKCARQFHRIPEERIVRAGSLWFRHIDDILQRAHSGQLDDRNGRTKTVLYAGSTEPYFPMEAEYVALDMLLGAIESGDLADVELVYRPVGESQQVRTEIRERYEDTPSLTIQFAQPANYRLQGYDGGPGQYEEYLRQLLEIDLVVASLWTSLALDAAHLGIASITNLADPTGTMTSRNTRLLLNETGRFEVFHMIPVAQTLPELLEIVKELLNDPERSALIARRTASQWDFGDVDYREALKEAHAFPQDTMD